MTRPRKPPEGDVPSVPTSPFSESDLRRSLGIAGALRGTKRLRKPAERSGRGHKKTLDKVRDFLDRNAPQERERPDEGIYGNDDGED